MTKEKQLEELANILEDCTPAAGVDEDKITCAQCKAIRIYNADYRKQIYGEWVAKEEMIRSITALNYTCSVCGTEGRCTPYCSNCGAKMRVG
jgi:hypothetical protein